ncbi:hypothetical protein A6R68_17730, partial [Neotoma lepida]
SLERASSTLTLFSEKFLAQHFEEMDKDKDEPQPGDLLLFKLQSAEVDKWSHAGVYCGHGEIIHFEEYYRHEYLSAGALTAWALPVLLRLGTLGRVLLGHPTFHLPGRRTSALNTGPLIAK